MRVPKGWLTIMAGQIVDGLLKKDLIEINAPKDRVREAIFEIMFEEVTIEDRLNDEVREILRKFDSEIEKGNLDYRRLFDMTKQKLVRERNIIL
ncbi:MAG: DUF507 family protein [Nitrospirae bacterium]|nr:DUF507 family protein [Nitrospirota bacterium]